LLFINVLFIVLLGFISFFYKLFIQHYAIKNQAFKNQTANLVLFAFAAILLFLQNLLKFVVLVPETPYFSTQLLILSAQFFNIVLA